MNITDLMEGDQRRINQVATLLVEGFKEHWPDAWPDIESAVDEVRASFGAGRLSRIALDDEGQVLGWVGAISQYGGKAWELHPLVVKPSYQRRGIGRALVADLEACVRKRGGLTIWAGSDDEDGMTSLSGVDLYPDVLERLRTIRNLHDHPYSFYEKVGFVISGVLPDANGPGKPDIFLTKSIWRR